jgi:hypothetical protein
MCIFSAYRNLWIEVWGSQYGDRNLGTEKTFPKLTGNLKIEDKWTTPFKKTSDMLENLYRLYYASNTFCESVF